MKPQNFRYTVYKGTTLVILQERNDIVIWRQKSRASLKNRPIPFVSEDHLTEIEKKCCESFRNNPNIIMSRFLNKVEMMADG